MSNIKFQTVGIEHISTIKKIACETWPNTFEKVMSKEQIQYMLNLIYNEVSLQTQMLEKGHQFILAQKNEQPLGFTSYELNYNNEAQLMIHKLYMLPLSQGLGIGTKLLNLLSNTARQKNNKRLRLKVYYENHKAIVFYEKYGFKKTGTETTDIGNGYNILDNVMIKEL